MRGRMFDWNDLRYFLAIARGGSIGTAAKALGVDQSTVQRRLRALETAFDCSLAEHEAGSYRLTKNGQQLLAHAERVDTSIFALQRHVVTLDNRATGPVKLTSHVTVGQRIIESGFLDRFHAGHTGITVELIMEQRALDLLKGRRTSPSEVDIRMAARWSGEKLPKFLGESTPAIHLSNATAGRPRQPRSTASA